MNIRRLAIASVLLLPLVSACGTVKTINASKRDVSLVMSGTRFDLMSMKSESAAKEKFGAEPVSYPALDIPLSATLDTLFLGATLPYAVIQLWL